MTYWGPQNWNYLHENINGHNSTENKIKCPKCKYIMVKTKPIILQNGLIVCGNCKFITNIEQITNIILELYKTQ
ncbi:hypothetical protein [Acanthamoeba polyphaga mimivirus]|uniref:Uncharacterized protein n=4 Tax=Megamimivirinae TaxID=3044648 RepID=A0A2L2DKZ3_MIMIV|nr:hypothetical protein MegaChil _gp1108 [Megavirus chiliensis]AEX62179.1 hypothetical protein c7_R1317 [Megavirus courdo7]AFX93219.1 hypothetical protein CE11_01193 [Megavirus courdo11]AVG46825.1 hypothetical protein [Acanthamoeba polyphaga mimivirus]AVL94376.1 hypothetical protein mvi_1016 [Megavirus vitis]WBF70186.1 hypothetical protein [Megavirus caiporensis]